MQFKRGLSVKESLDLGITGNAKYIIFEALISVITMRAPIPVMGSGAMQYPGMEADKLKKVRHTKHSRSVIQTALSDFINSNGKIDLLRIYDAKKAFKTNTWHETNLKFSKYSNSRDTIKINMEISMILLKEDGLAVKDDINRNFSDMVQEAFDQSIIDFMEELIEAAKSCDNI